MANSQVEMPSLATAEQLADLSCQCCCSLKENITGRATQVVDTPNLKFLESWTVELISACTQAKATACLTSQRHVEGTELRPNRLRRGVSSVLGDEALVQGEETAKQTSGSFKRFGQMPGWSSTKTPAAQQNRGLLQGERPNHLVQRHEST